MHPIASRPCRRALPTRRAKAAGSGLAAGLSAALIWGATLAVTRLGVGAEAASLRPHDLVLLRFLGPALLLLPVAWRVLPRLRRADLPRLLVLLAGGGAPFVLLAAAGLREAGAADAGVLLPGTVPLWVAAASMIRGSAGTLPGGTQRLGLALMGLSVALVAGPAAMGGEGWLGPALLLAAAWLATAYILALRGAGLTPLEATALVSLGSVLGFGPAYLLTMAPDLSAVVWRELAFQAAWQGGASGLLAPLAFAAAVARLGAARAAAFGALSPVAAALAGLILLGEVPDRAEALGLAAAAAGVALAAWPGRSFSAPAARTA